MALDLHNSKEPINTLHSTLLCLLLVKFFVNTYQLSTELVSNLFSVIYLPLVSLQLNPSLVPLQLNPYSEPLQLNPSPVGFGPSGLDAYNGETWLRRRSLVKSLDFSDDFSYIVCEKNSQEVPSLLKTRNLG